MWRSRPRAPPTGVHHFLSTFTSREASRRAQRRQWLPDSGRRSPPPEYRRRHTEECSERGDQREFAGFYAYFECPPAETSWRVSCTHVFSDGLLPIGW